MFGGRWWDVGRFGRSLATPPTPPTTSNQTQELNPGQGGLHLLKEQAHGVGQIQILRNAAKDGSTERKEDGPE